MIDVVMSAEQMIKVLMTLRQANVTAWIDGRWGVDALLGEQMREHDDLGLVVDNAATASAIRGLLENEGFVIERDWPPTALALRHRDGRAKPPSGPAMR